MASYFIGENFTVEFSAGSDLTGATAQIKWTSPIGITTTQTASITDAANGVFSYDVQETDLTVAGKYLFWSKITLASGKISISRPVEISINKEGIR